MLGEIAGPNRTSESVLPAQPHDREFNASSRQNQLNDPIPVKWIEQ
jgi:hypothetical protein